jgi:hypothetical protein
MKIVVNRTCGGFAISKKTAEFMAEHGSERAKKELKQREFFGYGYVEGMEGEYDRTDPLLVLAVETLKEEANDECSKLEVIEIPDNVEYYIREDETGFETIHEVHRQW